MKVPKDQYKVLIGCLDSSLIKGNIYVRQGLRLLDSLNHPKGSFFIVKNAEFNMVNGRGKLVKCGDSFGPEKTIILSKSAVKWVKEI